MPCSGRWFNNQKTIYYYEITEPWDWQEFIDEAHHGWQVIQDQIYTVNTLIDFRDIADQIPQGVFSIVSGILRDAPKNIHLRLVIGLQPQSREVVERLLRLNEAAVSVTKNIYFFDTLDEALKFLASRDNYSFEDPLPSTKD